jgi:hypothetical protein
VLVRHDDVGESADGCQLSHVFGRLANLFSGVGSTNFIELIQIEQPKGLSPRTLGV